MIGARNVSRLATAGFILTCAFVLGGMGWSTHVTTRLERLERLEEEHVREDARLRLAHWRMDRWLTPILAKESGRPYSHYTAYYSPPNARHPNGEPIEPPGSVLLASPLLEKHPLWVDVYFQVTPDGHWSSPQLPESGHRWLEDGPTITEGDYFKLQATLFHFASRLPPDELGSRLAQSRALARLSEPQTLAHAKASRRLKPAAQDADRGVPEARHQILPGQEKGDLQSIREFHTRQRQAALAQRNSLPPEACDPPELVAGAIGLTLDVPDEASPSHLLDRVAIGVSVMTPFWMTAPGDAKQKLVFVRTANIDGEDFYQGFLVDWDRFSAVLLELIADIYPDATLTPVFPDAEVAPQPSWLSSIPASLSLNEPQTASAAMVAGSGGFTLLISWGTAIVALAALGLGMRSLVTLTHRRVQFAYAVAHELRTPLTTFRLYTDMLAGGLVPDTSRQEYLDTLNRESKRLGDLVNDVLEYARLENRSVRRNPTTVDGAALLERAEGDFGRACLEEGVTFVTHSALPPGLAVFTDVDLLMCATGVLVANACRHSKSADAPEVRLQLEQINGRVCLSVIDNGPGVAAGDARHICKPFRRGGCVEPTGRGGLGLGLALACKWTRLLGGRLELAARNHPVHGGAEFRVSLPRNAVTSDAG